MRKETQKSKKIAKPNVNMDSNKYIDKCNCFKYI